MSAHLTTRESVRPLSIGTPGTPGDSGRRCWSDVPGGATSAGLEAQWRTLADRTDFPSLASPAWNLSFLKTFAAAERTRLHVLYAGERLEAVLPLQRGGRAVRTWSTVDNEHCPYVSPPMDLDDGVVAAALDRLVGTADCLVWRRLHEDGALVRSLREVARRRGLRTILTRHEAGDAVIRLASSWEDTRRTLPRNVQRDVPRKGRKLASLGAVTYERLVDGPRVAQVLRDCFALESLGWKGQRGSPIASNPRTLLFYSDLAAVASAAGLFALYTLRHDGRLVAFEYCLRGRGHIDMLKLSFHPDLAAHSPGGVLRFRILEHEAREGEVHTYHLGRPSAWKLRWATDVRRVVHAEDLRPRRSGPGRLLATPSGARRGAAPSRRIWSDRTPTPRPTLAPGTRGRRSFTMKIDGVSP